MTQRMYRTLHPCHRAGPSAPDQRECHVITVRHHSHPCNHRTIHGVGPTQTGRRAECLSHAHPARDLDRYVPVSPSPSEEWLLPLATTTVATITPPPDPPITDPHSMSPTPPSDCH